MNRIAIVGISGSGKSTLANDLGKKLNLPVFHLDKYFWDVGWKKRYSTEEFASVADSFVKQDKWIIDGNYRKANIDFRFERADTIILLDFSKWRCIWRVFTRAFDRKQPFDKTEGVKQRIDWDLVKWIINYKIDEMRARVIAHKDNKKVFVVRNNKEIDQLIEKLNLCQ